VAPSIEISGSQH